jgi:hypothetical protein
MTASTSDSRMMHDEVVHTFELHLGAAVFAEQHAVALLEHGFTAPPSACPWREHGRRGARCSLTRARIITRSSPSMGERDHLGGPAHTFNHAEFGRVFTRRLRAASFFERLLTPSDAWLPVHSKRGIPARTREARLLIAPRKGFFSAHGGVMAKVNRRKKSGATATSSVHSSSPQVLFRNMGPDERTVRLVYERNAGLCAVPSPVGRAACVVVEPVPEASLWDAELRLEARAVPPIRARAPAPDLAVQQAFDRLHHLGEHALAS